MASEPLPVVVDGRADGRVEDALRRLTVEEKVGVLSGCGMWEAGGVPRIGLPPLRMSDGPHGARGLSISGEEGAALAPCEAALAATFDEALVEEVGSLLGQECVNRGAHVLLGPCLNLQRWPLCGRHFECFSEDPYLSGRAAVAYVRGVQRHVAACAKHFVCNDQEDYRHTLSSVIDERTLREAYLAPFEAAVVEGGVESVMCGYNRLNGTFCTESEWLLQRVLRDEWGFRGFVLSDWWGNRSTVPAIRAGLNVEMPGVEPRHFGGHLLQAVRDGEVSESLLDERCRPVLRTLLRPRDEVQPGAPPPPKRRRLDCAEDSGRAARPELLRRAASESLVLLKNEGGALPLDMGALRSVALIGPAASRTCVQGGGSSRVRARRCATLLEALGVALPAGVELLHEQGCCPGERRTTPAEAASLRGIGRGLPTGQPAGLDAPLLALPTRLVDGALRVAAWLSSKECVRRSLVPLLRLAGVEQTDPAEMAARQAAAAERTQAQPLAPRWTWALVVGAAAMLLHALGGAAFHGMLVCCGVVLAGVVGNWGLKRQRARAEEAMLLAAGAAAASADAVVLALGTDGTWETEGMDQLHMRLLGRQNELVERVATAARGPVVVLLNVGSPKELPWLDRVQAVLLVHFGGEEMAPAVAGALLGASCPAGRLPYSWPVRLGDAPAVAAGPQATPGEARYCEGLRLGYRGFGASGGRAAPLMPFGHGLSYTSFSYGPLEACQQLRCDDPGGPTAVVKLTVGNRGSRAGAEVVQLYAQAGPDGLRALGAFARTRALEPGEDAVVQLSLGPRALGARFCEERGAWAQPSAGSSVAVEVGGSSADVRASAVLVLA